MSEPERLRPIPAITRDTQFWWDGIQERQLLIQRCSACGNLRHPPGPMCPSCHSLDWETLASSGRGEIYSFVSFHHPPIPPFDVPNLIVLVELDEGTRVVSNLPGVPSDQVRVGMPVQARFDELEPGRLFLQFEPA
ncbi:Zn-ribbon domain-containing OB-fold protein [Myxococcota bacterium]|nr:Zn-ribbon domain-containing OB-fold protein [Myxococcota bacterium]